MKKTIRIKTILPYQTNLVWQALTDSKWLSMWFMENDIEPKPGFEFQFKMAPQKGWDGITHCKIINVEPLQHISYTYKGEATGEKALACAGINSEQADKAGKGLFTKLDTILNFKLMPTCGGTILFMEQSGYTGFLQVIVSYIMKMGWKKQLNKKLPLVLEKMEKNRVVVLREEV